MYRESWKIRVSSDRGVYLVPPPPRALTIYDFAHTQTLSWAQENEYALVVSKQCPLKVSVGI